MIHVRSTALRLTTVATLIAVATILVVSAQEGQGPLHEIGVAESTAFGAYLVDSQGMSLYLFLEDADGASTCYDECAQAWPPLLVDGDPATGDGIDGALVGTTARDDGTTQITYGGWPLYAFARDAEPGDTSGHGAGGAWFLVTPAGERVDVEDDAESGATSAWDGVFTAEQAERGAEAYRVSCARCHGDDLFTVDEYAPDLRGAALLFRWRDTTLAERFTSIATRMPLDQPGSLEDQSYLDILAFILDVNEFPTGDSELVLDMEVLEQIVIDARPE